MFCCAPSTHSPWSDQTVQHAVLSSELHGTAQAQTPNLLPRDRGSQQFYESVGKEIFSYAFPKPFLQNAEP